MLPEISPINAFLQDLSLFNSLEEVQIDRIAQLFTLETLKPDEILLQQGQKAKAFYLIVEGQAAAQRKISPTEAQVDVIVRGDFFGEDSLLHAKIEPATIVALTHLTLLRLDEVDFRQVIHDHRLVEDRLNRFIKSHQYLEKLQFDWLNEDEVVYQVRRRHIAYLFFTLALPAVLIFIGLLIAGFGWWNWDSAGLRNASLILAAIVLGIGGGWAIWNALDWGNDYYVVTNQRVVWIEKVVWLYDSRNEAPLNTILSVNVGTSYIGRLLGFGSVVVTTYTGKIILEIVSNPLQLAGLISEYWQRAQRDIQHGDVSEMRRSVKRMLGDEVEEITPPPGAKSKGSPQEPDQYREPGIWETYFGNIFKTRIEEGRTITYRKHWLVLLKKTWLPALIGLGMLFLLATFDIMYLLGEIQSESPLVITVIGLLIILLIDFPWWLYQYVDWRNDIYQVTDRSIFDIERKPFGSESRKSAPLENILSLEHERPGFIGYVFNVGYVLINVGEAKFTFDNVHQPARVQQEVFNRMHAWRQRKHREETTRERERILKMIEIYHDEVGKSHSQGVS